jgi:mono/diheme cytochrome c family protein/uncharacterized membrane protein
MRQSFLLVIVIAWVGIVPHACFAQPPQQDDQPMGGGMMGGGMMGGGMMGGGQGMWEAPSTAVGQENPVPATPESVAAGKTLFNQFCASCHGSGGKGGSIGPDLTIPSVQSQPDGALFWKITQGKPPMPSFARILTDHQRWDVVNYIRTLAPDPRSAQSSRGVAQNSQDGYMGGYGHMMDHWGGGWIMWILMIVLIVLVVYVLARGLTPGGPASPPHETALDILKKRYARGEITKAQFDEMKKDL